MVLPSVNICLGKFKDASDVSKESLIFREALTPLHCLSVKIIRPAA